MKDLVDKDDEFKRNFQQPLHIPDDFFVSKFGTKRPSNYKAQCKLIQAAFKCRWHPSSAREQYYKSFSLIQWDRLSQPERNLHTLENCDACFCNFFELQKSFPKKPCYMPCQVLINLSENISEETILAVSLTALNNVSMKQYNDILFNYTNKSNHPISSQTTLQLLY